MSLALLPFNTSVVYLVAMLLVCELGSVLSTIWGTTAYQNASPPRILGQISSVMWIVPFAGNFAGGLIPLALVGHYGWQVTIVPGAVLGAVLVTAAAIPAARAEGVKASGEGDSGAAMAGPIAASVGPPPEVSR